jgi:hypothetical protein
MLILVPFTLGLNFFWNATAGVYARSEEVQQQFFILGLCRAQGHRDIFSFFSIPELWLSITRWKERTIYDAVFVAFRKQTQLFLRRAMLCRAEDKWHSREAAKQAMKIPGCEFLQRQRGGEQRADTSPPGSAF